MKHPAKDEMNDNSILNWCDQFVHSNNSETSEIREFSDRNYYKSPTNVERLSVYRSVDNWFWSDEFCRILFILSQSKSNSHIHILNYGILSIKMRSNTHSNWREEEITIDEEQFGTSIQVKTQSQNLTKPIIKI